MHSHRTWSYLHQPLILQTMTLRPRSVSKLTQDWKVNLSICSFKTRPTHEFGLLVWWLPPRETGSQSLHVVVMYVCQSAEAGIESLKLHFIQRAGNLRRQWINSLRICLPSNLYPVDYFGRRWGQRLPVTSELSLHLCSGSKPHLWDTWCMFLSCFRTSYSTFILWMSGFRQVLECWVYWYFAITSVVSLQGHLGWKEIQNKQTLSGACACWATDYMYVLMPFCSVQFKYVFII